MSYLICKKDGEKVSHVPESGIDKSSVVQLFPAVLDCRIGTLNYHDLTVMYQN